MRRLAVLTLLWLITASVFSTTAAAQRRRWEQPNCDLSTGHFLVNSAVLYLSSATNSNFEDQRDRQLRDAARVLRDAINRGRAEDPAVWYLWGRYYEMTDDVVGLDSAYTRAAELQPDCADDIASRRHEIWIPLINSGITAYQDGEAEAAIAFFRDANIVKPSDHRAYFYTADLLGREMNQPDSAIVYFEMALDRLDPEDPDHAEMIQNSTYMIGRYFQIVGTLDSAATWYQAYLEILPGDGEVIGALAQVYTRLGRSEEALAVYDNILENAGVMSPLDLFETGVNLFVIESYAKAQQAFELGLERNPNYRDGLYNLLNTYVAQSQGLRDSLEGDELAAARLAFGEAMAPYAAKLLEVDPGNQQSYMLNAQAFQLQGESDSTLAYLEAAEAMSFDVLIDLFQVVGGDSHMVHGLLTNQGDAEAMSPELTFEFLDETGGVVATEVVEPQVLQGGDMGEFEITTMGEGIVAWRYRLE